MSESARGKATSGNGPSDKEFSCADCEKEFASKTTLSRHKRNFHAEKLDHKCPSCDTAFETAVAMKSHHKQKHGESIAGMSKECEYCGSKFTTPVSEDAKYCSPDCWSKEQRDRVELSCENCGVGFEVKSCEQDLRECCSISCKAELQSKRYSGGNHPRYDPEKHTKRNCKQCGSTFTVLKSAVNGPRNHGTYCSKECLNNWQSENLRGEAHPLWVDSSVECKTCGKEFQKKPANIRSHDKHFCSRDCHGEWISNNLTGDSHPRWAGGHVEYGEGWYSARRGALDRDNHTCQDCGAHQSDLDRGPSVHHITPVRKFDNPNEAHYLDNLVTLCQSCHAKWEGLYLRPDTRE